MAAEPARKRARTKAPRGGAPRATAPAEAAAPGAGKPPEERVEPGLAARIKARLQEAAAGAPAPAARAAVAPSPPLGGQPAAGRPPATPAAASAPGGAAIAAAATSTPPGGDTGGRSGLCFLRLSAKCQPSKPVKTLVYLDRDEVSFGRLPTCTVVLDSDRAPQMISRAHAHVRRHQSPDAVLPEQWKVDDNKSTNGDPETERRARSRAPAKGGGGPGAEAGKRHEPQPDRRTALQYLPGRSQVQAATIECSHTFCWSCIDQWLRQKKFECPECRADARPSAPEARQEEHRASRGSLAEVGAGCELTAPRPLTLEANHGLWPLEATVDDGARRLHVGDHVAGGGVTLWWRPPDGTALVQNLAEVHGAHAPGAFSHLRSVLACYLSTLTALNFVMRKLVASDEPSNERIARLFRSLRMLVDTWHKFQELLRIATLFDQFNASGYLISAVSESIRGIWFGAQVSGRVGIATRGSQAGTPLATPLLSFVMTKCLKGARELMDAAGLSVQVPSVQLSSIKVTRVHRAALRLPAQSQRAILLHRCARNMYLRPRIKATSFLLVMELLLLSMMGRDLNAMSAARRLSCYEMLKASLALQQAILSPRPGEPISDWGCRQGIVGFPGHRATVAHAPSARSNMYGVALALPHSNINSPTHRLSAGSVWLSTSAAARGAVVGGSVLFNELVLAVGLVSACWLWGYYCSAASSVEAPAAFLAPPLAARLRINSVGYLQELRQRWPADLDGSIALAELAAPSPDSPARAAQAQDAVELFALDAEQTAAFTRSSIHADSHVRGSNQTEGPHFGAALMDEAALHPEAFSVAPILRPPFATVVMVCDPCQLAPRCKSQGALARGHGARLMAKSQGQRASAVRRVHGRSPGDFAVRLPRCYCRRTEALHPCTASIHCAGHPQHATAMAPGPDARAGEQVGIIITDFVTAEIATEPGLQDLDRHDHERPAAALALSMLAPLFAIDRHDACLLIFEDALATLVDIPAAASAMAHSASIRAHRYRPVSRPLYVQRRVRIAPPAGYGPAHSSAKRALTRSPPRFRPRQLTGSFPKCRCHQHPAPDYLDLTMRDPSRRCGATSTGSPPLLIYRWQGRYLDPAADPSGCGDRFEALLCVLTGSCPRMAAPLAAWAAGLTQAGAEWQRGLAYHLRGLQALETAAPAPRVRLPAEGFCLRADSRAPHWMFTDRFGAHHAAPPRPAAKPTECHCRFHFAHPANQCNERQACRGPRDDRGQLSGR
ncbi:unnamed protein product [Prorocentrum cordatum]|uniref:E3 ubiquitin-protein ligase CHFR n=1 Tax=Prorocentrum cordatum TaxID=2364126 RepID=A0ABN9RKX1_9DINO|nr:unnamed protein product [Polarella glacialis]